MTARKGHRFEKGNKHAWKKGQSGNPSGEQVTGEILEIFKAACPAAARRMVELIKSKDQGIALRATEYVINRVYGKPRESVEVKGDIPSFVALLPAKIDDPDVWEAHAQKVLSDAVEH